MDSHHLIVVVYKDSVVVAQRTQGEGRLTGGKETVEFIKIPANIERLKEGLANTHPASQAEIDKFDLWKEELYDSREWRQYTSGELKLKSYIFDRYLPSLSPKIGAGILDIIARATTKKRIPIIDGLEFAGNFWCLWTYVIDLDKAVLEVYYGREAKKRAGAGHRFEHIESEDDGVPKRWCEFTFSELQVSELQVSELQNLKGEEGTPGSDFLKLCRF